MARESDRVEWKQSAADANEILHAVCALANDLADSRQPGYLVLGLANDGKVSGVVGDLDKMQLRLSDRLSSTRLLDSFLHPGARARGWANASRGMH